MGLGILYRILSRQASLAQHRCIRTRPSRLVRRWSSSTISEEESLDDFHTQRYYPVRIGNVFNDRYQVLAKLGFDRKSTRWLTRDLKSSKYASLKIGTRKDDGHSYMANEAKVLRHLATCQTEHPAASYAILADDIFEVTGHICIVTKPSACTLQQASVALKNQYVPMVLIKRIVMRLLLFINWLHHDCNVIHTEILPQNIFLAARNDDIFERAEQDERQSPSIPVMDHSHAEPYPVYPSHGLKVNTEDVLGNAVLGDWTVARVLESGHAYQGLAMPEMYRAPEILMGLPWAHGVDVWCLGMMMLELINPHLLFNTPDKYTDQYDIRITLAQYIGLMGPPPLDMIEESSGPDISTCFDRGKWIAEPAVHPISFEELVTILEPGKDRDQFINLLKKIFVWQPEKRATTFDLFLNDEWLAPGKGAVQG